MKKVISLLLALLISAPAFPLASRTVKRQHKAMHEIIMVDRDADGKIVAGGLCTAYAVSEHTLMTAEHCNDSKTSQIYIDPTDLSKIKDNTEKSYDIVNRVFDHEDHMLISVLGETFTDTVELNSHMRLPRQGERTYAWGNPRGMRDQYREGVVMGTIPFDAVTETGGEIDVQSKVLYLVQTMVIGGDSGSAVFSAKDGKIIGIVTFGLKDGAIMGMFPIQFSAQQLQAMGVLDEKDQ